MHKKHYNSRHPRKSPGALMSKIALAAVLIFIIGLAIHAFRQAKTDTATPGQTTSPQDLWQVTTPPDLPQQIINYTGFTVSFNPQAHLPNYVIWELTADEATADITTRNTAKFTADTTIPGCPTPDDYRDSGFDRGHICPAADMKWSQQAMDHCHYMTNITPQTHKLNSGPWKTLETNCRNWAIRDSAIIIISGPILTDHLTQHIGQTNITVPERFFKIIYAPYANPPRGIAFIMNNYDTTGGVQPTATTIDQVEQITGFDFFPTLPQQLQNQIESQSNYQQWQRLKTR